MSFFCCSSSISVPRLHVLIAESFFCYRDALNGYLGYLKMDILASTFMRPPSEGVCCAWCLIVVGHTEERLYPPSIRDHFLSLCSTGNGPV